MYCVKCGTKLNDNANFCTKCGTPTKTVTTTVQQPQKAVLNGIYKYTLFGGKKEVYCPRCRSWDCRRDSRNIYIPGKTKTTYSANLNPLKPFTFANKKEKVIRQEMNFEQEFFVCNKCGKIFN